MTTGMDDMVVQIIYIFIYFGLPIIAIIFIYKHFKKDKGEIKDFKEQQLKDTLYEELKNKTDQFGVKTKKFKMVRDFQIVGYPEKYMIIDLEMPRYTLDEKTSEPHVIDKNPVKTRLMIIRSSNKNMLLRFLQLKKSYFIIELKQGFEEILKMEPEKKRICIQGLIDFETFGNVWIMSESGHEYLSNVSIKRALEQNVMHSENMADRVVHYDIQQAKLERRDRVLTDLEKNKYEERKNMGDSTIV